MSYIGRDSGRGALVFRSVLYCAITVLLVGCSNQNMSMNTMQFSGATVPYPENYEVEAARVIKQRGGDLASSRASQPWATIGSGPFSPQRWYVCIRGLPPRGEPPKPKALELAEERLGHRSFFGVYDVVLFFSDRTGRPSVRTGYDSPLCRDLEYHPINVDPPVI
jgi:hypothetical protein